MFPDAIRGSAAPFWTEILPPRQSTDHDADRARRWLGRLFDSIGWWPALAALVLACSALALLASQNADHGPQPIIRDAAMPTTTRDGLIDLNTATLAELETLPGIGASRADAIVQLRAQRPFNSLADLVERGILRPAQLPALHNLATVYAAAH